MNSQDIGIISVVIAMMVTFIVVMVKRSKASNKNASLVPEIEMKEA